MLRNVFFWHYETSSATRCRVAIGCYVVFWLLLVIRNFAPRRSVTGSAIVAAVLAVTLGGSLATQRWGERRGPEGVITAMDVTVYKGPGTTYQRQFEQPLQAGVEFRLLEDRAGWWDIRLADGKTGWISTATAELIVSPEAQARLGAL